MPRLLHIFEVASEIKMGISFVYNEINEGRLPYVQFGKARGKRVRREDLDKYIKEREVKE